MESRARYPREFEERWEVVSLTMFNLSSGAVVGKAGRRAESHLYLCCLDLSGAASGRKSE